MSKESNTEAVTAANRRDIGLLADRISDINTSMLTLGVVVRTGVGSYDCLVETSAGRIPCLMVNSLGGIPFGYPETDLPKEGSNVIVATGLDITGIGYIIGSVGTKEPVLTEKDSPDPLKQNATCREGPTRLTERIYTEPIARADGTSYYTGDLRLADIFPGEFVRMNEHGVGIDCDTLNASLRGGSAKVSVSRVDNTVEIVAGNFRQYDVSGVTKLAVDAGCITKETTFAEYVGERKGGAGLKADKKKHEEEETNDDRPVGKYRLRSFIGYLGNLISFFISRPKDNDKEADELLLAGEKEPKNIGLMHLNINDNGRLLFRSAGGFALERSDRIPVPVRIRDCDDPAGIKAEDIEKEDELAFELPEDDNGNKSPHYVPLALADKMAYDYKAAYDRFLEHITDAESTDAKNDFFLPKDEDVEPVTNDAGIPDRKVKPDFLETNIGRRSGIYNMPDGTIVIRDGWGSEAIFSGGNITFNTPGSIHLNPGYSVIATAGDDIVLKARNSMDLETTEHDISIHADKNMRIAAGSDTSTDHGGILIESLSKSDGIDYKDLQGEDTTFTGVIIKSNDSHVALLGNRTFVCASEDVRVVTGSSSEDEREGRVSIVTEDFGVAAEKGILLASKDGGLTISKGNTSIVGSTVVTAATNSVMFATKSQIGIPMWMDIKFDMVSAYTKQLENYCKKEKKGSNNDPIKISDFMSQTLFSFRNSEQCHTLEGIELTDPQETFTMYQPYWTVMAELKAGIYKDFKTEEWADHTVNGEYPWPGTDALENGYYAKLDHADDETLNQKKITVKATSVDSKGKASENDVDILCSKEYDEITGSENDDDGDRPKIKLEELKKFIVPVVSDQSAGDNKNQNAEDAKK